MQVQSLGQEDPLEESIATHSSIPAWRIPRTEEPGWLQSMGSQKVRHDEATKQSSVGFLSGSTVKNPSTKAGDTGSVPELRKSNGERNSNPLQYSCLENPTDRGAWRTTVHGIPESWTWLSHLAHSLEWYLFSLRAGGCSVINCHYSWHDIQ